MCCILPDYAGNHDKQVCQHGCGGCASTSHDMKTSQYYMLAWFCYGQLHLAAHVLHDGVYAHCFLGK